MFSYYNLYSFISSGNNEFYTFAYNDTTVSSILSARTSMNSLTIRYSKLIAFKSLPFTLSYLLLRIIKSQRLFTNSLIDTIENENYIIFG